jgi:CelD/BcsL family acetyltransferase involved in cellulose biosynthesis
MDELLDMGIKTFDLGLGDFSYKERWTDPQPVFDCAIPLTAVGRVAALGLSARTTLKRTIKQNPRLWETARQVRRAIHRMKPSR